MDNNLEISTTKGILWKLSERIAAQGVSFVVSVILARMLSPDDYSVVSIVAIFFAFANVFIYSGLNTALIQKKDADTEDYSSVLFASLIISAILYALLFTFAPLIASLYNKEILTGVIRIMGIILVINAFNAVLCAYISNRLDFKKFFFATIIGTVVSAFVGIAMAKKGYGPWALVSQQMTNTTIDTIILFAATKFKPVMSLSFSRLKPLTNYSWKMFVAGFISTVYDEALPLIVGLKYSSEDLAFYSKGKRFPALFSTSISDSISAVIFPVMSKLQNEKENLLDYTRKFMQISSFVIFPLMLGLFAVSDNLVFVLLTEKWMPCSVYLRIFCISCMFNIIQTGNLQTIKSLGRSDIVLKLEIIKKSLYAVIIFLALFLSEKPQILALCSIFTAIIATVVNTRPNRYLIGYSYKKQIEDIAVNLVISVIMCVAVSFVGKLNISKIYLLIIQVIVGMAIYVGLSFIFNRNCIKQIGFYFSILRGTKQ